MITLKSPREIALMKEAGRIVALAHEEVAKHIRPGISTYELDQIAYKTIIKAGASPSFKGLYDFPATICASINEVVVHGIPSKKVILKEGDIVSIDIGAEYKGYHGDSARTHPVGKVSQDVLQLLKVTNESLYKGLEQAKPGNHLSDISHAIQEYCEGYGYGVVREFTGHGIGQKVHEDPAVPNFGEPGKGPLLKEGMCLAVEPMITLGRKEVRVLQDGWTTITVDRKPAAHFEHSIAITKDGYEILTKL